MKPKAPEFPYPHHVDHDAKVVHIYFASGFPSNSATAYLTEMHYPGYEGRIVSFPVLEQLLKQ